MDARSERTLIARIQKELSSDNFDSTVVVITHRTSLLTLVDRVIVLDDGKIVGSGSVDAFTENSFVVPLSVTSFIL